MSWGYLRLLYELGVSIGGAGSLALTDCTHLYTGFSVFHDHFVGHVGGDG